MSIIIVSALALQRCATLQQCSTALCIEAAGRVEAGWAENTGRRPILWQKSSGQVVLIKIISNDLIA